MRGFCIVVFVTTLSLPLAAWAQDDELAAERDPLAATPMTCLMPSMPSLLNNAGSPIGVVTSGVYGLQSFMQDWEMYIDCIGNRIMHTADMALQMMIAKAQAKIESMQKKKPDQGS